jgi:hypothetical protein
VCCLLKIIKPLTAETQRRRENQENIDTSLFSAFVFPPRLCVSASLC